MSILKTRKLLLKRSYLLVEKEEVANACDRSEKEIKEYMIKYFYDEYEDMNNKITENIEQNQSEFASTKNETEEDDESDEQNTLKDSKDKEIKKMYRKIASLTHPDKINSSDKAYLFAMAAVAYRKNDVGTLLNIAADLDIDIPPLSPQALRSLEKNVNKLNRRVDSSKETIGWLWSLVTSHEEKLELLKKMLLSRGYSP
jgi:hypothetical protein